ncbi:MAG: divergent polysaccharide deacetylase family protein [Bauldia sp.]|nr:divergent polysaccharide deacetylase family protein [Bauldia sp.]
MAADELTRPLGVPRQRKPRKWPVAAAIAAPPLAIAIALAAYFLLGRDDPSHVVAAVDTAGESPTASIAPAPAQDYPPQTEPLVEVTPTGTLGEVGAGEVVISDPSQPTPIRLAAAPREDLVEPGEDGGLLPRIGDDGTRPLDAYARPTGDLNGMKRIAIVIGGIGIEGETGGTAIAGLPGEVTLALPPYGDDQASVVAEARAGGHEILLQLPMEPYNYPDIDPGPNTLTVAAGSSKNLDRLHWLLGQITTYVGVMNYMGARFTGDDQALAPVIGDVAGRGLLFLDDGSSARSRVMNFASNSAPVLKADLVLDGDTAPAAIDARLDQLVAIAEQRGYAIATATAFPSTVDRVAAFAKTAEDRGIALVPISAIVRPDGT